MTTGLRSVVVILDPAVKLVALAVQGLGGPGGICPAVHGVVRLTDQGGDLQAGCEVESVRRGDGKPAVRADVIEQLILKLIIAR